MHKNNIRKVLSLLIICSFCFIIQSCKLKDFADDVTHEWSVDNVIIEKNKFGNFKYLESTSIEYKHYYEIKSIEDLEIYVDSSDINNDVFRKYNNSFFDKHTLIIYTAIENNYYNYDIGALYNNKRQGYRSDDNIYIKRLIDESCVYDNNDNIYLTLIFEINGSIDNHYDFNVGIVDSLIN